MIYRNNNYSIDRIKLTTKNNYCLEIVSLFCKDEIITWKSVPIQKMSLFMFLGHTRDFTREFQELLENGPKMSLNVSGLGGRNQPV